MESDEEVVRQERLQFFVRLTERCVDVMSELNAKDLASRYATKDSGLLDSYVFTYMSDRTVFLDVMARFQPSELENADSHRFTSHPAFEKVIEKYTKTSKKPNHVLEKSRPWDVAVNMVMKIEAIEPDFCNAYRRLLKREHSILEHIWHTYHKSEGVEFDDMTGIPMLFDYREVPNDTYFLDTGTISDEIDLYGRQAQKKLSCCVSTLSYMTIEKLGPNLSYLVDLMSAAGRQTSVGLDFGTSLKMFDQLICRLLQVHRFGVIHNGVCPQNIYFGRGMCYNVVYINNFRAATLAASQPGLKPCINMRIAKDVRFASINMMKSTDMHPVDDIESAFYTLLASLGQPLPWDFLVQQNNRLGESQEEPTTAASHNVSKTPPIQGLLNRQFYDSIRASKSAFWESSIHLERYIANLMHRLSNRELDLFPLVAHILQDLYAKVKRLLASYSNSKNSSEFCSQLCRGGNVLYHYSDMRRAVLMYFTFEQIPPFLNNPNFLNKQRSLIAGCSNPLQGWNLSQWCFNSVEIRLPHAASNRRQSTFNRRLTEFIKT